ncbi:unnamed protein product, partial [Adineta steineri]
QPPHHHRQHRQLHQPPHHRHQHHQLHQLLHHHQHHPRQKQHQQQPVSTTAPTTANGLLSGLQDYAIAVIGNGYHGIQMIRYSSATITGNIFVINYPIVYLSGTTFSTTYVNNAWYGLHGGCGNANGIAGCTAVCKALSKNYFNMTTDCGTGFIGSFATYVNPDRAVYTSADTVSTPWTDYNQASTCSNPMFYCTCSS